MPIHSIQGPLPYSNFASDPTIPAVIIGAPGDSVIGNPVSGNRVIGVQVEGNIATGVPASPRTTRSLETATARPLQTSVNGSRLRLSCAYKLAWMSGFTAATTGMAMAIASLKVATDASKSDLANNMLIAASALFVGGSSAALGSVVMSFRNTLPRQPAGVITIAIARNNVPFLSASVISPRRATLPNRTDSAPTSEQIAINIPAMNPSAEGVAVSLGTTMRL